MRYRKKAPQAPRLLLRVVAGAGVAAVAATTSCSGPPSSGCHGFCGVFVNMEDASMPFDGGATLHCDDGGCLGVVVNPTDAGDGGADATPGPCGGGVCGISIMPSGDAGDSSTD